MVPEEELQKLLVESFSFDEIRILLDFHGREFEYENLLASLPLQPDSLNAFVHQALGVLQRRQLINAQLFDRIRALRPNVGDRIMAVASRFGLAAPPSDPELRGSVALAPSLSNIHKNIGDEIVRILLQIAEAADELGADFLSVMAADDPEGRQQCYLIAHRKPPVFILGLPNFDTFLQAVHILKRNDLASDWGGFGSVWNVPDGFGNPRYLGRIEETHLPGLRALRARLKQPSKVLPAPEGVFPRETVERFGIRRIIRGPYKHIEDVRLTLLCYDVVVSVCDFMHNGLWFQFGGRGLPLSSESWQITLAKELPEGD